MASQQGSILFRRLLGRQLYLARKGAGLTQEEAAARISRGTGAVSRYESGDSLIDAVHLEVLCQFFGLGDEKATYLVRLREIAAQRPWWSHLGQRVDESQSVFSEALESMLMLEDASYRLDQYDGSAIPGLLQTPEYARAVNEAIDLDVAPERQDIGVQLRLERQVRLWNSDRKMEAVFLIDENAIARMPVNSEARLAQLTNLLSPPMNASVQIVPFEAGTHPSLATYVIYSLDVGPNVFAKGVHVEGAAAQQGVVAETELEVAQYELVFAQTRSLALSQDETARYLHEKIKELQHG